MDPNQRSVIISDFDLDTDFGDRRQELVFIGAGMDEGAICSQMDTALLSDAEMAKYRERYAEVIHSNHPLWPHSVRGTSKALNLIIMCSPCKAASSCRLLHAHIMGI